MVRETVLARLRSGPGTRQGVAITVRAVVLWLRRDLLIVDVRGRSMEPTLTDGDHLLCSRRDARRTDAIVVRDTGYRNSVQRYQIKRLVAGAGEQRGGRIIATGYCWIEGDNTAQSGDSRTFGPVQCTDLIAVGFAVLRSGQLTLLTREPATEPTPSVSPGLGRNRPTVGSQR